MDLMNKTFDRLVRALLVGVQALPFQKPGKLRVVETADFKSNYPFVYVAGFGSWGQYQKGYLKMPYWGGFAGENYIDTFNQSGFTAVAADVSPLGSAWDRACELYAQLTGKVVDYGRAHAEKYHHPRYGADYTGKALLQSFSETDKINIICHSFGGPTSALFATLMEYGSKEEQEVTTDGSVSELFTGGKGSYIHSITGLAGAYNGTTLLVAKQAIEQTVEYVHGCLPLYKIDPVMKILECVAHTFENITTGDTPDADTGLYDMVPDNSVVMNKGIKTVPGIYYFTVPCCTTAYNEKRCADYPDMQVTDVFFWLLGLIIGRTDTVTPGGLILDKAWQPNDGLVNTISERGPMNETLTDLGIKPGEGLGKMNLNKGQYYVFNTYIGSHNDLCGGTLRPNFKARKYLTELMKGINSLE